MYLIKTPELIKKAMPEAIWSIPTKEKTLYLTFDDGPIPEITPWVLKELKNHTAKGTFFCVGNNVKNNPEIYRQLIDDGHAAGNHTFDHLQGWKTNFTTYMENVDQCAQLVDSKLFRPPHGRLTPKQYKAIKKEYSIVMWDVICGDFNKTTPKEKCVDNVISNAKNGSVVLFHDSIKAADNLYYSFPKILDHFARKGYSFETIQQIATTN